MSILKLFHVLFVFVWIGSLLALSRLLGYQSKEKAETQLALARIYKRMYFVIDLPCMILAVTFGIILLYLKGERGELDWRAAWLHLKLTFAFFLIICDILCGCAIVKMVKQHVQGRGLIYKVLHGVIGACLIVVLVAIYIMKNGS